MVEAKGMSAAGDDDYLRVIIGTAMAMIPRKTRRAWAEVPTAISDPAHKTIAAAIASAVRRHYFLKQAFPAIVGRGDSRPPNPDGWDD